MNIYMAVFISLVNSIMLAAGVTGCILACLANSRIDKLECEVKELKEKK